MSAHQYIAIDKLCKLYNIEDTFIAELYENGLITIKNVEKKPSLPLSELKKFEKMQSLYYDLEINIAGIDAIVNLLNQMEEMKHELMQMKRRIDFFQHD